ncbi:MAG: DNA/RNA nuclease SfsA [Leptospirales bacterium]|nr:DNA/RNA nuclease SfsA [Leptospirales bacterium]
MYYSAPLTEALLLRRYKRFLADVRLPDGSTQTVFCANPGSMRTCLGEGWRARISDSGPNSKRKLRYTLEQVHNGRCWIGVKTHQANFAVREALQQGRLRELGAVTMLKSEVQVSAHSRLDFALRLNGRPCYLEVKSVSMCEGGVYYFPDAPSARARRHLSEMSALHARGARAILLFLIQRSDGRLLRAAETIDPAYARALRLAAAAGVEVRAYRLQLGARRLRLAGPVQIEL